MPVTDHPVDHQDDRPNHYLNETAAMEAYNVTKEGLPGRRRRGTVKAHQDEEGNWTYQPPVDRPRSTARPTTRPTEPTDQTGTITALEARVASLETQLVSKDEQLGVAATQIGELHRLLAQTALNAAPARPWWRFWR